MTIEQMKERKNGKITDIDATIICEKDSHKGIIIGKGGSMLKKIGSNARFEIEGESEKRLAGQRFSAQEFWISGRCGVRRAVTVSLADFFWYIRIEMGNPKE